MTDWQKRAEAAERTVAVLQRKVIELYGSETTTFQRQLARARDRQARANQRHALLELRAQELARYSTDLELQVAERTRAVTTILDNVTSGFVVVDAELVIADGFTKSCHALLDAPVVAGRTLTDVLRVTDERMEALLQASVEQVFASVLPDDVAVELVPRRFALGARVLWLDARVIRREGSVAGVLFTITDITALEKAQGEAKVNHVLVNILRERETFCAFVVDTRELLAAAREALASGAQDFARRALHTVKGNASTFDLDAVVATIHAIESKDELALADVDEAEEAMRAFVLKHRTILALAYDAERDESYTATTSSLEELKSALEREPAELSVVVDRWASGLALRRADQVLGPLGTFVSKLAERLDKEVSFALDGGDTLLDVARTRPILQTLSHILRNAVDHGIEHPDERAPKPARGRVELRIEDRYDEWVFTVSDDGHGIDGEALAASAMKRGLLSVEAAAGMAEEQKLALVFCDGLSTTTVATTTSGRGVGMAAVGAAVKEQGGRIEMISKPGIGTSISLVIPKRAVLPRTNATVVAA